MIVPSLVSSASRIKGRLPFAPLCAAYRCPLVDVTRYAFTEGPVLASEATSQAAIGSGLKRPSTALQVVEVLSGMAGQTAEDVGKPSVRKNIAEICGFDQRV